MPADTQSPTAERIRAAAIDLFFTQGYNATTLRQIAQAVDLQVGSLYNHIESKEQLLFEIMKSVMLDLVDSVTQALDEADDDPAARVTAFLGASIRFHALVKQETFIGNTELRGLSSEHRAEILALRDRYEAMFREVLAAARDAGALDIGDLQLATFSGLAICTSVATWYRPDGRLPLEDLEHELPLSFGPLAARASVG